MNGKIIKVLVLPNGTMPRPGRPGEDVGYDTFARAIVNKEIDPKTGMRDTLWDFNGRPHPSLKAFISDGVYQLYPGCSVRIGLGVVFGMTNEWFAHLVRRSSSAEKMLTVNAENTITWHDLVPIDPGFRGEPCALITNHGRDTIPIAKNWCPSQLVFHCECCGGRGFIRPTFMAVSDIAELGQTVRKTGDNGSSKQLQLV